MNNQKLLTLNNFDYDSIESKIENSPAQVLFIFSCGYEKRSLKQFHRFKELSDTFNNRINFLCLSFTTFKDVASRPLNDRTLKKNGIKQDEVKPDDWDAAWACINNKIAEFDHNNLMIFVDYSSMPRNLYCMLGVMLVRGEIGMDTTFLYTKGRYSDTEHPYVGYGQFKKFSGRPNIAQTKEVNIFGLGFDSTRTYGIWTYLDPNSSVAILAKAPNNENHSNRVYKDNSELIAASNAVYEVPMNQFNQTLSSLVEVSREYSRFGDVALVPDGPKPLILAMSLVPLLINRPGVYSWHVGHTKPKDYVPIDIDSSGETYGFSTI